jgi:hypothetical protein
MALSMLEWQVEAEKMSSKGRNKILNALVLLNNWPAFRENYGWTGYETVGQILRIVEQEHIRK